MNDIQPNSPGAVSLSTQPPANEEILHCRPRRPGILVADDDVMVCQLLQFALEGYGFSVRVAHSGREAVEIHREAREQVVAAVLDVQMPDLDGPRTLTALRRANPALPCCFMSGDTGAYTRQELVELGRGGFFTKPFVVAELVKRLEEICVSARRSDCREPACLPAVGVGLPYG